VQGFEKSGKTSRGEKFPDVPGLYPRVETPLKNYHHMTEFFSEESTGAVAKRPVKRARRTATSEASTESHAPAGLEASTPPAAAAPALSLSSGAVEGDAPKKTPTRRKKTAAVSDAFAVESEQPASTASVPTVEGEVGRAKKTVSSRRKKPVGEGVSEPDAAQRVAEDSKDLFGQPVKARRGKKAVAAAATPISSVSQAGEAAAGPGEPGGSGERGIKKDFDEEIWRPGSGRGSAGERGGERAGERGGAPVEAASSAESGSGEGGRKAYPVYVPLHVAKQMEQEGKTAPLAVDPNAQQAAAIRAAALESRRSTEGEPTGIVVGEGAATGRQERAERPERPERGERPDRHDRHGRRRGRPDRHDRGDRGDRGERPERGERPDRFRGRREEGEGYESSQELPPPTPEELEFGEGVIEVSGKGFGFLRDPRRNFVQSPSDVFVSPEMVRRYNLRDGQWVAGQVRRGGRGQQMHELQTVNGQDPELSRKQPAFDELTVINPNEPLRMETVPERYTTRVLDIVAPIGKGQRGLIVAPPRTGKTTLLQHIADAMVKNHPEVKLIMLLVDERPEEVTEIRHTVPTAEIMASSNDMDVRSHTRIAELAIERAKRLVEAGQDVFILLDSITRLGRAFNNALTNGGRTMSGGMDARALEIPRRLFAAARNTEEAGSLTIIATALVETGSRMDELIFQEFKGTGNMELVLDRKVAEQRVYPAVEIFQSGTRREELLVPADLLSRIHFLRRGLAGCRPLDAIERLLFFLKKFPTNEQMLREIRVQ
jgi:transcription termination factor Rho